MDDERDEPEVNAEENSIAIGGISVGGDIRGDVNIGHTKVYQYESEEDVPLTSDEIENGLTRLAGYIPERAPILEERFASIAKKLRATLGADLKSLSPSLKKQRQDTVDEMKLLSMEVLDISFRALCQGQNPPPYDSRPPFLGLFAFRPEDKEFFFGREALIQKLVTRITGYPFLAVLGGSGSGKSSLVMAGLIPALDAKMAYFTPSTIPLYQLHAAQEKADKNTVFVVDQFEELFTLTRDLQERAQFISELIDLTKKCTVVITMRADFWGEVATHKELKDIMQEHQELIAPMDTDELHSAMRKQAAAVGLRFDQTLSESILDDVRDEPGAMPLLQHALWMLWKRRHGLYLKAEEYQNFGGVKQAIASTAEDVYASCSDFEKERVHDIFLRLTRLDESGEGRDTRRRALIQELTPANSDPSATIQLLNKLADARLIVKTNKEVEVAHEALIRNWKRLNGWLNEDRENLQLREDVSEAAREWDESGREESLLNHRGARLEHALAMSRLPRYTLNPLEQAYLNACVTRRDEEIAAREGLRRRIWAGLGAGIVIALILTGFALYQMFQAQEQASIARAGELAAQSIALRDKDFSVSLLLGLEAYREYPSVRAQGVLLDDAQANPPLYKYLVGHQDQVFSVAFSPDGKILASGGRDKAIILWDMESHQPIEPLLTGHGASVLSVAFSPDGAVLASGGGDQTIFLWDVMTHQAIDKFVGRHGRVYSVAFHPDGSILASGNQDSTIILWDMITHHPLASPLTGHAKPVTAIAFAPDGKILASGSEDNKIILWDVETHQPIDQPLTGHTNALTTITFSPDGRILASGGADNSIILWDVETHQPIDKLAGHEGYITSIAFSPDGKTLVSGSVDRTIILWSMESHQRIGEPLMGHANWVRSVTFSPDGKTIASGGSDNMVILWDLKGKSPLSLFLIGHKKAVYSVALSVDGQKIASGSADETIILWDMKTGQPINPPLTGNNGTVISVAFSPDGKILASGGADNSIILWDVETHQPIDKLAGHEDAVYSVAFSPDGKILASGSLDTKIILWDIESHLPIGEPLIGHKGAINSLAFSPDGKILASGSEDKTIILWNVGGGQPIGQPLTAHEGIVYSIAFSPDGRVLASGSSDFKVILWNVENHKPIKSPLASQSGFIYSIAFSPDGRILASGGYKNSIQLWDVENIESPAQLGEPLINNTLTISSLAFSHDGKSLVSGNADNTVILWDLDPQSWIEKICQRVGRNLLRDEWTQYFQPNEDYRATCPQWPEALSAPAP